MEYLYKTDTIENNKIRHLEYNEKSEAVQDKDVQTTLSNLQYKIDNLTENVYQIKSRISSLRNIYLKNITQDFLGNLSKNVSDIYEDMSLRIEAKNYKKFKEELDFHYEAIRDYVNNITQYISEKSSQYVKLLDDAYDYFYCFSGLSNKKLYTYYKTFLYLISCKYSVIKDIKFYEKYFGKTPNEFDIGGDPDNYPNLQPINNAALSFQDEVVKNQALMKEVLELNYEVLLNVKFGLGFHYIEEDEEEGPETLEMEFDFDEFKQKKIINEDNKDNKVVTKKNDLSKDDDDDDDDGKKGFLKDVQAGVDVELDFKIEGWNIYFNLKIEAKAEYSKDKKWGHEIIIAFPAFPLFQMRIGIKFEIGFKVTFGVEIALERNKKSGFGWQIKIKFEFVLYAKLVAYAQAGIYVGQKPVEFALYCVINGTIIEARVRFKLYLYINKN